MRITLLQRLNSSRNQGIGILPELLVERPICGGAPCGLDGITVGAQSRKPRRNAKRSMPILGIHESSEGVDLSFHGLSSQQSLGAFRPRFESFQASRLSL